MACSAYCARFFNANAADDDPWYSALSAAFKKHNMEVMMVLVIRVMPICWKNDVNVTNHDTMVDDMTVG